MRKVTRMRRKCSVSAREQRAVRVTQVPWLEVHRSADKGAQR